VAVTVHVPAPEGLNDGPIAREQPADPASVTLYEKSPLPVPPEAANKMFVLNVPLVDVKVTAACVILLILTVVAEELATR
jgi:hypothetical protein